jgi:hypothetical protein
MIDGVYFSLFMLGTKFVSSFNAPINRVHFTHYTLEAPLQKLNLGRAGIGGESASPP